MKLNKYIIYVVLFTAFSIKADEKEENQQTFPPAIQKINELSQNSLVAVEQLYPKSIKYPYKYINCINEKNELSYNIY